MSIFSQSGHFDPNHKIWTWTVFDTNRTTPPLGQIDQHARDEAAFLREALKLAHDRIDRLEAEIGD